MSCVKSRTSLSYHYQFLDFCSVFHCQADIVYAGRQIRHAYLSARLP